MKENSINPFSGEYWVNEFAKDIEDLTAIIEEQNNAIAELQGKIKKAEEQAKMQNEKYQAITLKWVEMDLIKCSFEEVAKRADTHKSWRIEANQIVAEKGRNS